MLVVRPMKPDAQVAWSVQLIDPASHKVLGRAGPLYAQPICADISADGSRVVIGLQPQIGVSGLLEDTFETWDLRTEHRLAPRMIPPRPPLPDTRNASPTSCLVAFSPNGAQVATSGATVHVWNTVDGREVMPVTPDTGQAGSVSQPIAWAADGSRLAIGRRTGSSTCFTSATDGQRSISTAASFPSCRTGRPARDPLAQARPCSRSRSPQRQTDRPAQIWPWACGISSNGKPTCWRDTRRPSRALPRCRAGVVRRRQ